MTPGRVSPRTRQALAVVAVAVLLALAGCGSGGDGAATTASPGAGDGSGGTVGEIDELADVAAVGDGAAPASFTITSTTRISDEEGTVFQNRTVRVGPDGTAFTETRRRVTGPDESASVSETYTTGDVTYVRHSVPDVEAATYERVSRSAADLPGVAALAESFDFEHERIDGRHRFTVDSAEQVAADAFDGEVRSVSIVVIVSDAGVVTELRYDLVVQTDDGTVEYHTERTVTRRGSTTVSAPEWLSEAEDRTPPVRTTASS